MTVKRKASDRIRPINVRLPESTVDLLDKACVRGTAGGYVARNTLINAVIISCSDIDAIAREIAKGKSK
jgi:hypothetical protein